MLALIVHAFSLTAVSPTAAEIVNSPINGIRPFIRPSFNFEDDLLFI